MNENIGIGLFKESFLKILIEGNNQIRKKKLIKLQLLIECYTLPIRNLKCSDRINRVINKYKNNQKNSFKKGQKTYFFKRGILCSFLCDFIKNINLLKIFKLNIKKIHIFDFLKFLSL